MWSAYDVLDVLWAEELAHELSAPLAFFDRWTLGLARGETIETEDLEIAREEMARLRLLVTALRSVRFPRLQTRPRPLRVLVTEATRLYEASAGKPVIRVEQAVPASLTAEVNATFASDVLEPLLRVVAASTQAGGIVEMTGEASRPDVVLSLRGEPSVASLPAETRPWTLQGSFERELAVACRVVRAHGGRVAREALDGAASLRVILPSVCGTDPGLTP